MGTQATVRTRVDDVYYLLLNGCRRKEILKYAIKNEWGVKPRSIDKYISKATEDLRSRSDDNRDAALEVALKRLDWIYNRSMTINDYKTALAIQREINELKGLHEIKIEHNVSISQTDELRQKIDMAITANPTVRSKIVEALGGAEDEEDECR